VPIQVDSTGSRVCTSTPWVCQLIRVATAKLCRRSDSRGRCRPGGVVLPASSSRLAKVVEALVWLSRVPPPERKKLRVAGRGHSSSRRAA
jgi:hypothetical protein